MSRRDIALVEGHEDSRDKIAARIEPVCWQMRVERWASALERAARGGMPSPAGGRLMQFDSLAERRRI